MFIDKDSIIIDGISMGQYLTQATYQYNKLWSSDSGRNMAGVQSGTLIGIFPKLVLQFRKLKQSELELLVSIFDSSNQSITYYDPFKKANTTMTTYTGDWQLVNKNINNNEGFEISFISISKRV